MVHLLISVQKHIVTHIKTTLALIYKHIKIYIYVQSYIWITIGI